VGLSGDRQAITEALRRIAERALEATPEGGRFGMVLTASSASARIRITDRGAGMTPDQLRRLARIPLGHPGDATAGSLHLARIAVELHGGTLRVTSRRGEGSQFEVELPLLAEEA
jgi:signal transduction histidine kinase